MPTCRLLIDEPADGAWNMAVDEVLLARAAREGEWTLRFYGWREATLSLGYFQPAADRDLHQASRHCPLVRRPSGGGAIVHDREITYSLAARIGRSPEASRRLYRQVHTAIIEVLAPWGVQACLCDGPTRPAGREPFLCFQRRAEGDVLLGDAKIVGSAQRRRDDALLQHGCLLLAASPAAPELPGVASLTALHRADEAWLSLLSQSIARSLSLSLLPDHLNDAERERVARLQAEKYGQPRWNDRK